MPAAGVPDNVAVPLLLLTKVTPVGSAPDSLMLMPAPVGKPVVVTEKVPAIPTVKVVLFALVIVGASLTVRVKFWAGVDPAALLAVNVMA